MSNAPFLKMNGLGNEIIVADMRGRRDKVTPAAAVAINADPATKFDQILTNVEGLTSGDEGKGMFTEVAAAAAEVRKLAANLDVRTAQLATNLNKFTGPGLRQYEALAAEGRRTLAEIERVFRNLERNPRQFLFGGSSVPGYTGR